MLCEQNSPRTTYRGKPQTILNLNNTIKITNEMKNSNNRGKSISLYIRKLRGETISTNVEITIHDNEGKEVRGEEIEKELETYWKGIYQKQENKIPEIWTEENKRKYEEEIQLNIQDENIINTNEIIIPEAIREHFDHIVQLPELNIKPMKKVNVTLKNIENQLKNLKKQ